MLSRLSTFTTVLALFGTIGLVPTATQAAPVPFNELPSGPLGFAIKTALAPLYIKDRVGYEVKQVPRHVANIVRICRGRPRVNRYGDHVKRDMYGMNQRGQQDPIYVEDCGKGDTGRFPNLPVSGEVGRVVQSGGGFPQVAPTGEYSQDPAQFLQ